MISAIVLVAFIRLLLLTHNALACAAFYAAIYFVFGLMYGEAFLSLSLSTLYDFGFTWVFFSLLVYFSESFKMWWLTFFAFVLGPPLINIFLM